MATLLFVHGTGVRKGSYLSTLAIVQQAIDVYQVPCSLAPCLWGDDLGAKLPLRAVPGPSPEPRDAQALDAYQEYARWELLYRDPLFELRLLRSKPDSDEPRPPTSLQKGNDLWRRIAAYQPSPRVRDLLELNALSADWDTARTAILADNFLARQIVADASDEIGEPARATARALVAHVVRSAWLDERPTLTGQQRDQLVEDLVNDWGADVYGVGTFLLQFVADVATSIGTPLVRWRRGELTQASAFAAGDVLLYQARGQAIRRYIRRCVEAIDGEVVILAHSLGGVAAVDLLISEPLPQVTRLVTVGSQAALFHELGALWSLEPGTPDLPEHFPRWLNVYDPYDFLSYVAAGVFPGGKAQDYRVESDQPFPQSHSAYWTDSGLWSTVRSFIA